MPPVQVFTFIIAITIVIFGAYFVTVMVARGPHKIHHGGRASIKVLDHFSLAKDKSLVLVAVYDKIYLVAYAAGSIALLDNIDPQTAAAYEAEAGSASYFNRQPGKFIAQLFSRFRNGGAAASVYHADDQADGRTGDQPGNDAPGSFFGVMQSRMEREQQNNRQNEGDKNI